MAYVQKAVVVTEVGKPLALITDREIPQPGLNQVQIKVNVAGLNPHDEKTRNMGLFVIEGLPAVLANDVVGTVTQLGAGVTKVNIGDRVVWQAAFAPGYVQNGLQEYAVGDVDLLAKIPDSISNDQAATLPTNVLAPLVALFEELNIPAPWTEEAKGFDSANTKLLIVGGGSNCGRFAVQLAKLAEIGTIIVVGGNEAELTKYGATHIIDRHGGYDLVLEQIRAIVGDDLIYAFDAVNVPDGQVLAVNALSNHTKGTIARLLPLGPIPESKVLDKHAGYQVKNVFGSSHAKPHVAKPFWDRISGYLKNSQIIPTEFVVRQGLDADIVNEVLDAYRDGKSVTKTHIHL